MLFVKKSYKIIILAAIVFSLYINTSFALEDNFGPAKKIEGKHFTVYYAPQLEIYNLTQQLNISPADNLLVGKTIEKKVSSDSELSDMLDTLFMQVCDILDMHLYSFQGNIKICRNQQELNKIYYNLFNKDLKMHSFYVYDFNAIYISADNFKPEILGHEIGHMVISHYFVVQPSVKIQEILASYVEYQLRKSAP